MSEARRVLDLVPRALKAAVKRRLNLDRWHLGRLSYSQEGEDMIVARILADEKSGFYVDVGAHHPRKFSNTQYFYSRGWRGINIDAMPGSMDIFDRLRPRDINLEIGIGSGREELTYYKFNQPALNTCDRKLALARAELPDRQILSVAEIRTWPLAEILHRYVPPGQAVDLLNVDVEGWDYEVLESNDWQALRPTVVLVEDQQTSLEDVLSSAVTLLLEQEGYVIVARTFNTSVFLSRSYAQDKRPAVDAGDVDC
jgi:FkbM family methyltransferase